MRARFFVHELSQNGSLSSFESFNTSKFHEIEKKITINEEIFRNNLKFIRKY